MFGVKRFGKFILTVAILFHPLMLSGETLKCDTANTATVYTNCTEADTSAPVFTIELIQSLIAKTSEQRFNVEFFDGRQVETKIKIMENKLFLYKKKERGVWKEKVEMYEVDPRGIKNITLTASGSDRNETAHGFIISFLGFLVFSIILVAK